MGENQYEQTRCLLGYRFVWTASIDLEIGSDGKPIEYMPQNRYPKAKTANLNRHGAGPFCRMKLTSLPKVSGVYLVTINNSVTYIGKAVNLAERWGPQNYATISPRNCFKGGQSTNCKINHRILLAKSEGTLVDLWFLETGEPDEIETQLIDELRPRWNG